MAAAVSAFAGNPMDSKTSGCQPSPALEMPQPCGGKTPRGKLLARGRPNEVLAWVVTEMKDKVLV